MLVLLVFVSFCLFLFFVICFFLCGLEVCFVFVYCSFCVYIVVVIVDVVVFVVVVVVVFVVVFVVFVRGACSQPPIGAPWKLTPMSLFVA